jgi:hypothetical protein
MVSLAEGTPRTGTSILIRVPSVPDPSGPAVISRGSSGAGPDAGAGFSPAGMALPSVTPDTLESSSPASTMRARTASI